MGNADLHMHSTFSDGYHTVSTILTHVEQNTKLDVIAITDHDCIDGALLARDLVTKRNSRIQIITGAEISTRDGHLLALNIEHIIPADLSMIETVQAIHEQGGLAVVAHPLSRWCPSATMKTLLELKDHAPEGLEVTNGSFAGVGSNKRVRNVNNFDFGWAELGGSDAHTVDAIGSSYVEFPGTTAEELIAGICNRTTAACGNLWTKRTFARYGYRTLRSHIRPSRAAMERVG